VSEPPKAVFLSYASDDAEAARRICEALRAAGIEVWFDQSELRGGDVWDQAIRRQIKACALFIPVISRHTHARDEGYFRLEWKLATDRTQLMASDKAFLVPVVIDDTPDNDERVPDRFRDVQWTRLPGGATPASFIERVKRLLAPGVVAGAAVAASAAPRVPPVAAGRPARPLPRLIAAAVAGALLLGGVFLARDRFAARSTSGATAEVPERSVAVLPFADMSERHDQEYFSDGLAEELIDALTKVPGLRVPARTSSFSFKGKSSTIGEIARALGVTHVLEGSVRKAGDRLRITAELVRADNGFHLWSQTYDRNESDIFAVQGDIARSVASELRVKLLGAAVAAPLTPAGTEAHNLYLQARFLTQRDTRQDLEGAVVLYQKALALDPGYAPAWAWLAYCHTRRVAGGVETTGVGYAKAVDAAEKAIALDPELAEGYLAIGNARIQFETDFAGAQEVLAKARAIDPNDAQLLQSYGHLTVATGRITDAIEYFRRSSDGDPLNLVHRKYLARALHYAGRNAEAQALLTQAIALNPRFPGLHYEIGRALIGLGKGDAALVAFEAEIDPTWKLIGMPLGYRAAGREREAQGALAALVQDAAGSEFQVAEAYAFFGQPEKAFEWLDRARTQHDPGISWVRHDPLLASIAHDRRYDVYLASIHEPPVPAGD